MQRTLTVCAALAAVAVLARAMPSPRALPAAPAGDCPNIFVVEPLVIFDVSGFSLGGAIHRHLTVYNNGLASISNAGGFPPHISGTATFTFLPVGKAIGLARDLFDAGAWDVCDELVPISDTPITTVTVLRGGTNAPSHTYSYYTPESPEATEAAQILADFVDEHFPDF